MVAVPLGTSERISTAPSLPVRLASNTVATFGSTSSNLPREARHDLLGMRSLGAAPRSSGATFLKLNGYETYIPRVREQRLRRGKRIETVSPLFPAYAFIVIEAQGPGARGSMGGASLIREGDPRARFPDRDSAPRRGPLHRSPQAALALGPFGRRNESLSQHLKYMD